MTVTIASLFAGIGLLILAIILVVDASNRTSPYDRPSLTEVVLLGAVFTGGGALIGVVVEWLLA